MAAVNLQITREMYHTLFNSIFRQDLFDIIKVNVANAAALVVAQAGVVDVNSIIQETGTSLIILASLGYTIFKGIHMYRTAKWAKQDRADLRDEHEG